MPEKINFQPEEIIEYQKEMELLKEKGGFYLEKKGDKNIIKFLGLRGLIESQERDVIVEFETEIDNEEEIKEIIEKEKLQQTPLFRKMFTFLVDTYHQDRIPLLQSVPGTGKTYVFKLFNKFLHGKDSHCEYICCTPRTTELDLIGHWTPAGEEVSSQEIASKLEKDPKWQELKEIFWQELEQLSKEFADEIISQEKFQEKLGQLTEKFAKTQKKILFAKLKKQSSNYVFRKGALLRGFKDPKEPENEGNFVIIDEIDNLPENYQNILLQLCGSGARITETFTSYSDSGVTDYKKGNNTFFALAANYPELAPGKRSISSPLADRVDFLAILPSESLEDEKLRIEKFSFSDLLKLKSKKETIKSEKSEEKSEKSEEKEKSIRKKIKKLSVEEKKYISLQIFENSDFEILENIREFLGKTLAFWHLEFKKRFFEYKKEGLVLATQTSRIREQEKEFSQRAVIGVEEYVLTHLKDRDFLNPKTGRVDMGKLLASAFEKKYLSFLASEELRNKFFNEVISLSLTGKSTEKTPEEVKKETPYLYVEENGKFRQFNPQKDKLANAKTLNEVFDILVERASISEEEKRQSKTFEEERKKRELFQGLYNAQDEIEALLRKNYFSGETRRLLEEKLEEIKDAISKIPK